MTPSVIDSSVILAVLRAEKIDSFAYSVIDGGIVSTVAIAEIYTKVVDWQVISDADVQKLLFTLDSIEPLSLAQAQLAGRLREKTSKFGLSLGDRACLALAIELGADVYTTDRAWSQLSVGLWRSTFCGNLRISHKSHPLARHRRHINYR